MLKKIKLSEENKDKQEFITSMNTANKLIDELSLISLKIQGGSYSKEFSFLLNKFEGESHDKKIMSDHKMILNNYIDELFSQLKDLKLVEHDKNIGYLDSKVTEAVEISKNHENFKEARLLLIAIQKEFSEKYIKPESHEFLWSVLQDAFTRLKKRENSFFEKRKLAWTKNYEMILPEVNSVLEMVKEDCNFKETWNALIKVQKKFKGLKLERENQQELWTKLQDGFEKLKKYQEKFNESAKDSWDDNYKLSLEKIEKVSNLINTTNHFKTMWQELKETREFLTTTPTSKEQNIELNNKLQLLFDTVKKKQQARNEELEKLKEGGFDKLDRLTNRALNEAKTNKDLDDVFHKLKGWQQDIFKAFYITKDEKAILVEKINEAFNIFQERRKEESQKRRENWLTKQKDFLQNITNKKEKLINVVPKIEKSIQDSTNYIVTLESEISEDETKAERLNKKIALVKEQIEEKKQNIIELGDKIKDLESLIEDVNSKLNKNKK